MISWNIPPASVFDEIPFLWVPRIRRITVAVWFFSFYVAQIVMMALETCLALHAQFIFYMTDDGLTSVGLDDVVNFLNLFSNTDPQSSSLGFVGFSSKNFVGSHISVISRLHHQELTIAGLAGSTQSQSRDVSS